MHEDIWEAITEEDVPDSDKCECGAETTYGEMATHSDWCPKGGK